MQILQNVLVRQQITNYQAEALKVCRKVAFTSLAACLPSVPIILSVPTGLKVLYLLLKRMQMVA